MPLVIFLALTGVHRQQGSAGRLVVDLIVIAVVALIGLVHWLVTRWAFDGVTLRIETGLIRRDSRQLPVARIQAVDIVQPFLARLFGLAELRIRLAGATSDSRLAYLAEPRATNLRSALLAAHHGLDPATPEPDELPVTIVPTGRLVGSVLLSGGTAATVLVVAALVALPEVSARAEKIVGGFALLYAIGLVIAVWRRFNGQYGFTVAAAPDGIRVRRGLIGTVAETVPIRRVQAVRQIEPLWWRPFGWCRLEVDVAGMPGRDRGAGSRRVTKTLLPVGSRTTAGTLREVAIGAVAVVATPPPRRARAKAPLSFHFLAAGHDHTMAVAVTGRVCKVTCWVPLEKAQSVRRIQGPLQRALGLATVRLDVAGRRASADFRDRPALETEALVDELAALSGVARHRAGPDPAPLGGGALPHPPGSSSPGWFPDPSGRHRGRYWDGARWTEHVEDDGVPGVDPVG